MSIVLFQLTEDYDSAVVAAYALMLTLILLAAVWGVRRVIGLEKVS
jgi:ABC-type Fe3+ transport system permease subunit